MTRFLHQVAQEAAEELGQYGLTAAQFQLLVAIQSRPGVSQKDLVVVFGVTKGNISQLVTRIESAGLVLRDRNQGTDELTLSAAGQDLLAQVVPAHDRFMKRTFAALSDAEQHELRSMIRRLNTP